jgi:hypothetical protein
MEEKKAQLRDAVMDTFRAWGGQWNVSTRPPGHDAERPDSWVVRVHSHPFTHGFVAADVVDDYLSDPSDASALARWEESLRAVFEAAKAEAG